MADHCLGYRLIPADGVPDPDSLQAFFHTYDCQTVQGVTLLGALQTLRFDPDMPRWQMMHRAYLYVSAVLQPRKLSSILVQHMPSDARSAARPHVHIFTLSLEHRASGFGRVHPDFRDHPADMQLKYEAEWNAFRTAHGWSAG
ncbi:hypothetical protein PK98_15245 [Croceibacterium mercuriale]|uniref:Uncharacterized protein n=1 Tax=Croceibacterium mercuriale TaxID=1572751 RepID=A0A0B2BRX5_9SPHN|nr:hypothetical protein [Croceibacterium mercuriale]KHL24131.1 hypothetical protein PK98_15245 [Croceibacterium mercuriale]